ncbi:sigma-54-dependent Fis family transcriptional regulator [Maledivibacter halophilus]|uniref:PAS domain S-box-containing protein n=1 Tax=Maledivibacter halophilus TaxID=36842 RepID=A0A1T5KPF4_9FIRM|nr:sigma-54-dependent Fis family transcriptional regulator [Maledivibacter halophilus]SKC65375.1 PAS domain S-box-containing protein [Maledivibacter halophilus]
MDNYNNGKEVWKRFINEGYIDSSVSPVIAESWKRCKKYGVDPLKGIGKKVSTAKLDYILKENKELLEVARPIMANLHEIVVGTDFALVLTDKNGHIIETIGNNIVKNEANKIRFNLGALWSEEAVGTNAIGTTLAIDEPIQVLGEQHYCITHHPWTCSATTIHDGEGNVIGCLNMSGDRSKVHSHTLGIVVAAAYTIEKQIALLRSYELVETIFESTSDGIIVVDKDYKIKKVKEKALKILDISKEDIHKLDVREIFKDINFNFDMDFYNKRKDAYFTDCNAYINGKRIACSANIVPMITNNEIIGFAIVFKETKYLHKTVNRVTGNVAIYTFENIISKSKKMKQLINSAKKIAKTKCCILIEGESGTGKELFAHAIHNYSSRFLGPFVAINCASLPRDLIESELFGYEKGSFTGALKEGKPGKFELANGGTIFLDEIGELPLELQAKLLRVLDNLSVRRIGGDYEKNLDIRIIAATNRNLLKEVTKKNFREDLYYRLNVFKLEIPPLRKRKEDVRICVNYFLNNLNKQNEGNFKSVDEESIRYLENYRWIGNVRELQNIIERAYYLCDDSLITIKHLPEFILNEERKCIHKVIDTPIISVENVEKNNIIKMLMKCQKNVIQAGKNLNMSKSTIYRKIKKYNIDLNEI